MNDFLRKYWLGLGVVAVVLIAVGVWLTVGRGPNLNINKDVQSKCMTEVNDKTFCKFAGVFANVGDYTAVMQQTAEAGTTKATIAVATNGNSSMTVEQPGSPTATIVTYGGNTYVKDPADNQWIKYASNSSSKPEVSDIRKSLVESDFKNDSGQKEQYISKGTETVNGFQTYKYQVIDPAKKDTQSYIWFGKSDYLLRKLSGNDPASGSMEMTISYAAVNIAQPSPVKATTQ